MSLFRRLYAAAANLLVASTNFAALPAIWLGMRYDRPLAVLTLLAASASLLYHLIEHHKHHMPGLGSKSLAEHNLCINLDRGAALCLGLYVAWNYWSTPLLLRFIGALSLNFASELLWTCSTLQLVVPDEARITFARWYYVAMHSLWHLFAFSTVYFALSGAVSA